MSPALCSFIFYLSFQALLPWRLPDRASLSHYEFTMYVVSSSLLSQPLSNVTLEHPCWTIWSSRKLFWKINFHFHNKPHAAFPFPACRERDTLHWNPKVNYIKGYSTSLFLMQRNGHPTVDPKSEWGAWPCGINLHFIKFINKPHAEFPFSCMQRRGDSTVHSAWTPKVQNSNNQYEVVCTSATLHANYILRSNFLEG